MGTMYLKGSLGKLKVLPEADEEIQKLNGSEMTLTADSCVESDRFPMKFSGTLVNCFVQKDAIVWTHTGQVDY